MIKSTNIHRAAPPDHTAALVHALAKAQGFRFEGGEFVKTTRAYNKKPRDIRRRRGGQYTSITQEGYETFNNLGVGEFANVVPYLVQGISRARAGSSLSSWAWHSKMRNGKAYKIKQSGHSFIITRVA